MKHSQQQRGTAADRNARIQHNSRVDPPPPARFTVRTYALRMEVSAEAMADRHMFNLSNRHYLRNGKRGGPRRRYEPYWGEA